MVIVLLGASIKFEMNNIPNRGYIYKGHEYNEQQFLEGTTYNYPLQSKLDILSCKTIMKIALN